MQQWEGSGDRLVKASRLGSVPKRRQVTVATLRKWQSQYKSYMYHQSLSRLQCDIDQESHGMVDWLPVVRGLHERPTEHSGVQKNSTELN